MSETHDYRGHRIELEPFGSGWRARVYTPGATLAENEIPWSADPASRTSVLDTAKLQVDRILGP